MFICLLYAYRIFLYAGIRKNENGIFNKYNELFLKTDKNYDVLFIGSSRAEMHFNPAVFDSITGLNSYNFGIAGATPKISYALLKAYCAHHSLPKYLIFNVDYFYLDKTTGTLNDFPRYFPYLKNHHLRSELHKIDTRFNSFYYNPLHSLPYTQLDFLSASLHGWLNISGKYDSLMHKGYQTSVLKKMDLSDTPIPKLMSISTKNKADLDSIINYVHSKNMQLVLVTSPIYGGAKQYATNYNTLLKEFEEILQKRNITYLNYSDSLSYNNQNLYADYMHLNRYGAHKFTQNFSLDFYNKLLRKPLFNK